MKWLREVVVIHEEVCKTCWSTLKITGNEKEKALEVFVLGNLIFLCYDMIWARRQSLEMMNIISQLFEE